MNPGQAFPVLGTQGLHKRSSLPLTPYGPCFLRIVLILSRRVA
jgi:hypothetical protein